MLPFLKLNSYYFKGYIYIFFYYHIVNILNKSKSNNIQTFQQKYSYNLIYNYNIKYIKIMSIRNLKILLSILVLLLIIVFGALYKLKSDNKANRIYKQGINFYNDKNYSDAYYNFKQIKRVSNLYELSLLKQFQCANNLQDKKTALIKLRELIKVTKDKNIRPYALYYEAMFSEELNANNKNQLYKKYKYIHENYPENDFAVASAYKMAQILGNKNKALAKEKYIEYLKYAPTGKFAKNALDNLILNKTFLTSQDYEIIALSYLYNNDFQNSLNMYKNTNFENNWYNISKCYRGLRNYQAEKNTILKGLQLKTINPDEKNINAAIDRLINLTNANKVQLLQELYTNFKNTDSYATIAYNLAENSNSIRAIKLYELVMNEYPNSIWASNSLWEVFWYNYKLSRYKVCESLAKKHSTLYANSQDAPRIAYWQGKVLLKEKRNQQAKEAFYNVINKYPLSYYSFLSARQLKMSKAKKMIVKKPITSYNINSINKYLFKDKLLLKLAEYNDYETIDELKIQDEYIKAWVLNKEEIYPKSITTAKNELNKKINSTTDDIYEEEKLKPNKQTENKIKFSDFELKLMYPVLYEDKINELTKQYKQSPYLFLSLIREESHFDKNAKSSAGATGLTQLMKDTANYIEKRNVPEETLLNPEENIRIGIKYFAYLVDKFNKNEFLAILSYNAGPGNVEKWMNNPLLQSNEIDVFVENVPFLETKNYIKKILSSYWIYLNIYSPKNK